MTWPLHILFMDSLSIAWIISHYIQRSRILNAFMALQAGDFGLIERRCIYCATADCSPVGIAGASDFEFLNFLQFPQHHYGDVLTNFKMSSSH